MHSTLDIPIGQYSTGALGVSKFQEIKTLLRVILNEINQIKTKYVITYVKPKIYSKWI